MGLLRRAASPALGGSLAGLTVLVFSTQFMAILTFVLVAAVIAVAPFVFGSLVTWGLVALAARGIGPLVGASVGYLGFWSIGCIRLGTNTPLSLFVDRLAIRPIWHTTRRGILFRIKLRGAVLQVSGLPPSHRSRPAPTTAGTTPVQPAAAQPQHSVPRLAYTLLNYLSWLELDMTDCKIILSPMVAAHSLQISCESFRVSASADSQTAVANADTLSSPLITTLVRCKGIFAAISPKPSTKEPTIADIGIKLLGVPVFCVAATFPIAAPSQVQAIRVDTAETIDIWAHTDHLKSAMAVVEHFAPKRKPVLPTVAVPTSTGALMLRSSHVNKIGGLVSRIGGCDFHLLIPSWRITVASPRVLRDQKFVAQGNLGINLVTPETRPASATHRTDFAFQISVATVSAFFGAQVTPKTRPLLAASDTKFTFGLSVPALGTAVVAPLAASLSVTVVQPTVDISGWSAISQALVPAAPADNSPVDAAAAEHTTPEELPSPSTPGLSPSASMPAVSPTTVDAAPEPVPVDQPWPFEVQVSLTCTQFEGSITANDPATERMDPLVVVPSAKATISLSSSDQAHTCAVTLSALGPAMTVTPARIAALKAVAATISAVGKRGSKRSGTMQPRPAPAFPVVSVTAHVSVTDLALLLGFHGPAEVVPASDLQPMPSFDVDSPWLPTRGVSSSIAYILCSVASASMELDTQLFCHMPPLLAHVALSAGLFRGRQRISSNRFLQLPTCRVEVAGGTGVDGVVHAWQIGVDAAGIDASWGSHLAVLVLLASKQYAIAARSHQHPGTPPPVPARPVGANAASAPARPIQFHARIDGTTIRAIWTTVSVTTTLSSIVMDVKSGQAPCVRCNKASATLAGASQPFMSCSSFAVDLPSKAVSDAPAVTAVRIAGFKYLLAHDQDLRPLLNEFQAHRKAIRHVLRSAFGMPDTSVRKSSRIEVTWDTPIIEIEDTPEQIRYLSYANVATPDEAGKRPLLHMCATKATISFSKDHAQHGRAALVQKVHELDGSQAKPADAEFKYIEGWGVSVSFVDFKVGTRDQVVAQAGSTADINPSTKLPPFLQAKLFSWVGLVVAAELGPPTDMPTPTAVTTLSDFQKIAPSSALVTPVAQPVTVRSSSCTVHALRNPCPIKYFCDLTFPMQELALELTAGRRAALIDVGFAFNRMTPGLLGKRPFVPLLWWDNMRYKFHGRFRFRSQGFTWRFMSPAAAGFPADVFKCAPGSPAMDTTEHRPEPVLLQSGLELQARAFMLYYSVQRFDWHFVSAGIFMHSDMRPNAVYSTLHMLLHSNSRWQAAQQMSIKHGQALGMYHSGQLSEHELEAMLVADLKYLQECKTSRVPAPNVGGANSGTRIQSSESPLLWMPYCRVTMKLAWTLADGRSPSQHWIESNANFLSAIMQPAGAEGADPFSDFRARELRMNINCDVGQPSAAVLRDLREWVHGVPCDWNEDVPATHISLCWTVMSRVVRALTALGQMPPPARPRVQWPHTPVMFGVLLRSTTVRLHVHGLQFALWQSQFHVHGLVLRAGHVKCQLVQDKDAPGTGSGLRAAVQQLQMFVTDVLLDANVEQTVASSTSVFQTDYLLCPFDDEGAHVFATADQVVYGRGGLAPDVDATATEAGPVASLRRRASAADLETGSPPMVEGIDKRPRSKSWPIEETEQVDGITAEDIAAIRRDMQSRREKRAQSQETPLLFAPAASPSTGPMRSPHLTAETPTRLPDTGFTSPRLTLQPNADANGCPAVVVQNLHLVWTIDIRDVVIEIGRGVTQLLNHLSELTTRMYPLPPTGPTSSVGSPALGPQAAPPAFTPLISDDQLPVTMRVRLYQPQVAVMCTDAHSAMLLVSDTARLLVRRRPPGWNPSDLPTPVPTASGVFEAKDDIPTWFLLKQEVQARIVGMSAFVAPTDVDLGVGISWLDASTMAKLAAGETPTVLGSMVRRVLSRTEVQCVSRLYFGVAVPLSTMTHTTGSRKSEVPEGAAGGVGVPSAAHDSDAEESGPSESDDEADGNVVAESLTKAGAARRADEVMVDEYSHLNVLLPELGFGLDAEQFQQVLKVVRQVFLGAMPALKLPKLPPLASAGISSNRLSCMSEDVAEMQTPKPKVRLSSRLTSSAVALARRSRRQSVLQREVEQAVRQGGGAEKWRSRQSITDAMAMAQSSRIRVIEYKLGYARWSMFQTGQQHSFAGVQLHGLHGRHQFQPNGATDVTISLAWASIDKEVVVQPGAPPSRAYLLGATLIGRLPTARDRMLHVRAKTQPPINMEGKGDITVYEHLEVNVFPGAAHLLIVHLDRRTADQLTAYFLGRTSASDHTHGTVLLASNAKSLLARGLRHSADLAVSRAHHIRTATGFGAPFLSPSGGAAGMASPVPGFGSSDDSPTPYSEATDLPGCHHMMAPRTRTFLQAGVCAAQCGKPLKGVRVKYMQCTLCEARMHVDCAQTWQIARIAAEQASIEKANERKAVERAAAERAAADLRAAAERAAAAGAAGTASGKDDSESQGSSHSTGQGTADDTQSDTDAIPPNFVSHQKSSSAPTTVQSEAEVSPWALRTSRLSTPVATPSVSPAVAKKEQMLYFQYIRIGSISLSLTTAGFSVNLKGAAPVLATRMLHARLWTWRQFFTKMRHNVVWQVTKSAPSVMGSLLPTRHRHETVAIPQSPHINVSHFESLALAAEMMMGDYMVPVAAPETPEAKVVEVTDMLLSNKRDAAAEEPAPATASAAVPAAAPAPATAVLPRAASAEMLVATAVPAPPLPPTPAGPAPLARGDSQPALPHLDELTELDIPAAAFDEQPTISVRAPARDNESLLFGNKRR